MSNETPKLDFMSIVLLGVNSIIGSGIFLLPHQTYQLVGTSSLFILFFDALLAIVIGLCFAKAASLFQRDGGPYIYAKEAFGEFAGFEVGFIKWVVTMIALATQANAFTEIMMQTFPAMRTLKPVIIIVLILFLTLMNLFGTQSTKWLNNIATVGKLVPLILMIVIGLFAIKPSNFGTPSEWLTTNGHFGQAMVLMFYGFAGFESLPVVAGEMSEPQKQLPKALLMVMTVVPVIYLLLQFVSIGILGKDLGTQNAPIQFALTQLIGQTGLWLVAIGTLISIVGIMISLSFVGPRLATALAHDQLLPTLMAKENRFGAPRWSVLISGVLTLIIALSGSFTTLATISVIARFAQYIPTILAVMKFKNQETTFKLPGGNLIPLIALLFSLWLIFQASWQEIFFGVLGLLIAVPIYWLMRFKRQRMYEKIME